MDKSLLSIVHKIDDSTTVVFMVTIPHVKFVDALPILSLCHPRGGDMRRQDPVWLKGRRRTGKGLMTYGPCIL